ncbi:hypothetical protein CAPI_06835 [Corynebacterium capitovis DSM 44611]|uniref:DUF2218 domain-containing protein n=1 Tax=Corynebacterium capitovis TaxID=131081 RepID=UPI0004775325|nr:DUF2218 domain-containing protein [Corynebacterium capitovis]WKD57907.1 hypothetical protein CAPI_06835 [Corynebacterium capitovis DSM 44611]
MGELITSTARVRTERAGRYGKQMASHFGRKIEAEWDPDAMRGQLVFPSDGAPTTCDMLCGEDVLMLTLQATPENVERMEGVVGRHLERFGERDGLVVTWVRGG